MTTADFEPRIAAFRARLDNGDEDPRTLHSQLQALILDLDARGRAVPHDLRDAAAALEAEIVEEFYDNMPV